MNNDKCNPNDCAFAIQGTDSYYREEGLTKREYFAAQVLGVLASNERLQGSVAARIAVECADALIEELNK